MRITRLWLGDFRGLRDVTLSFRPPRVDYGPTDIRFLVGRNGSGKSTALEAIALIFSHVAAGAHPGFEFELEYELRGTGVRVAAATSGSQSIASYRRTPTGDWEELGFSSAKTTLLPDRIVGYSTGPTSGMREALFEAVERQQQEHELRAATDEEVSLSSDELERLREAFLDDPQTLFFGTLDATLPTLAVLATDAYRDAEELLSPVELDAGEPLLAFSLRIASAWDELLPRHQHEAFRELLDAAAIVTRQEDELGASSLLAAFDVEPALRARLPDLVGTPLTFLDSLVRWQRRGVLERVHLVMRKRGVAEPITETSLSDGELFFLSRYGLLVLMATTSESLLLLDEPETHFNDRWKVDLVDSMMRALGRSTGAPAEHQVIIATHSDLTLTDADPALVQLFVRRDGVVEVCGPPASTFGAAPGDLGRLLFGLSAPVGNFAEQQLRDALERDDPEDLRRLADVMGPGYLRFALQARLFELEADTEPGR